VHVALASQSTKEMYMSTAVMHEIDVIEAAINANAAIVEKITSAFEFIGPRGKRADFCSDCCGSNGNSCQPS
jgi:hypothetical protein